MSNQTVMPVKLAIKKAARYFSVQERDIIGKSRFSGYVNPRHVAMWIAMQGRTYHQVAPHFNRDHSTIVHALKRVERMPELKEAAELLCLSEKKRDWIDVGGEVSFFPTKTRQISLRSAI